MSDLYYETLAWHEARTVRTPPILEALRGTQVVEWYGRIERQLLDKVNQLQATRNFDSKAKMQTYLDIWRKNELTGSINVDAVNALLGPAEILASDSWNEQNYFLLLRDNLRQLKASQEELPPFPEEDNRPGPRPRRRATPAAMADEEPQEPAPSQDFGAEDEPGAPAEPIEEPR